jgi:hypothetical protein
VAMKNPFTEMGLDDEEPSKEDLNDTGVIKHIFRLRMPGRILILQKVPNPNRGSKVVPDVWKVICSTRM